MKCYTLEVYMANTFFRFKQFEVDQSGAAMKVGTDGVLLGARTELARVGGRAGEEGGGEGGSVINVLDIGTGTGLIALMMAQRFPDALIDAIEMDEGSFLQAQKNIRLSPWDDRINVHHITFQQFSKECKHEYDLVVCNPPFFSQSLKPPSKSRTLARHDDSLTKEELIVFSSPLIKENGILSVILPFDDSDDFIMKAKEEGLFLHRMMRIRPTPQKGFKRCLMEFSKFSDEPDVSDLCIELSRHVYTQDYMDLTRDFYLLG